MHIIHIIHLHIYELQISNFNINYCISVLDNIAFINQLKSKTLELLWLQNIS